MGNSRNYQELVKKVTMYLDNELPRDEERKLLKEIQSDPNYMELLKREKSFKDFIKRKLQRRQVSPALVHSIKTRIQGVPQSIRVMK